MRSEFIFLCDVAIVTTLARMSTLFISYKSRDTRLVLSSFSLSKSFSSKKIYLASSQLFSPSYLHLVPSLFSSSSSLSTCFSFQASSSFSIIPTSHLRPASPGLLPPTDSISLSPSHLASTHAHRRVQESQTPLYDFQEPASQQPSPITRTPSLHIEFL